MAKKIKKYKVGIDSETYAISMVEAPAIESDFVALSKEEEMKVFLEKDERHMVYGAALIPEKDIYRYDGEHEFYISFTKDSIEKMSQDFMKNYRQNEVTLDHEEMANDITITESWLVEDPYKDKANALGIDVPQGTWMVGMKVNQIDVWERIKSGELKGFSVESIIQLEEFSKQNNNMETNEQTEMLLERVNKAIKEAFKEMVAAFGMQSKKVKDDVAEGIEEGTMPLSAATDPMNIEPIEPEALEEQVPPTEPTVEPQNEPSEPQTEPNVEDAPQEPQNEPQEPQNEPQADNSHLEELINSLKAEIDALKEMNNGLNEKVKEMGKQPSVSPVNTNAKNNGGVGVGGSTYQAWRKQMEQYMIG